MSEINCDDVLRDIEHYLHGELDPKRSAVLAFHLSTCSPCLDRAEFQRKLKEIVRLKCQAEAPGGLTRRIRLAIRAEKDPEEGRA